MMFGDADDERHEQDRYPVFGTTERFSEDSATFTPSTADGTNIMGVITPSP
jgi:hypothetical protein